MHKLFRYLLFLAITTGVGSVATAGELVVKVADGRATVIARDVPLRDILAEWARVGNTRVVNAEKLAGGPVTLELVNVAEKEALDILLRSAAGYMAAPRPGTHAGASLYDRVIILASSRPPPPTPNLPQPFNRQMIQQPQPPPEGEEEDDDGEPSDQGPVPPPGMMPNQPMPFPGPPAAQPNDDVPATPQTPVTSPRPGVLPQPQPTQTNPYAPTPGARVREDDGPND